MIKKELVREYYKSPGFHPYIPDKSQFYHFRVLTNEGVWKKIKVKIRSEEQLKKQLINLDAGDVYFSTALWLDPRNIACKDRGAKYVVADQIMIDCRYVFDFDGKNISIMALESARVNAKRFYEFMKNQSEFELEYCVFTGAKGLQLSYKKQESLPIDPRQRILFVERNRKDFKDRLPKNIIFDNVSLNPLLVRRLPGTVNTKTGYIATIINPEKLDNNIHQLLIDIPYIGISRPGIPYKGEMTGSLGPRKHVDGGEAGLAPHRHQFISNQVQGVKDRYVLALQYSPGQKYIQDAKFLQKHYGVGNIYVLEYEDYAWLFSPQTFPHKRLIKILARTNAINKHQQRKFRHTLMPFVKYKLLELIEGRDVPVGSLAHNNMLDIWIDRKQNFKFQEGKDAIRYMKASIAH